ncbi:unnamed protein product [Trifolium pratense]|uniref:Uncharacterized protein n=1 Tax=Trifolium pratense TaxID=57577 RepID=A0ACB0IU54_TRIPR|nr:unnamed protein product [Trifolium pratense]
MGLFQVTPKYLVVFLALYVAYNNFFLITHARPIKPLNQQTSLNADDSGASHADSFRPTTPRSSPGVGHRNFVTKDKTMKTMTDVESQSPNVKVYVTSQRSDDGFKPTNPSHSPGVGHAYHTKIGHLN